MPDLTSFRGARALVIHPEDANRDTLVRTLKQLGLLVAEVGSDNETAILAARAAATSCSTTPTRPRFRC